MRRLAIAAILLSQAALAQVPGTPAPGPDNGFFRPTPFNDPSLTRDPVLAAQLEAARQQAAIAAQQYAAQAAAQTYLLPEPPAPSNAEVTTALAASEAEAERQRALMQPAPIAGAFTGLTGSENR